MSKVNFKKASFLIKVLYNIIKNRWMQRHNCKNAKQKENIQ